MYMENVLLLLLKKKKADWPIAKQDFPGKNIGKDGVIGLADAEGARHAREQVKVMSHLATCRLTVMG